MKVSLWENSIRRMSSNRKHLMFLIISLSMIRSTTEATSTQNYSMACDLSFLNDLQTKYSHQPTFLQSVEEMAVSLLPLFQDPDQGDFYQRAFLAMAEPERTIAFRVSWMDDKGNLQFNRGWRVEFNRYACALMNHA